MPDRLLLESGGVLLLESGSALLLESDAGGGITPSPGPAGTGGFTYLFADLVTNNILAELPLDGVSFEVSMNAAGAFTGTLNVTDPRITKLDWLSATQTGRTAVYVDLNGVLVWGGVLWTRRYNHGSKQVALGAQEFWSFFGRQELARDYTGAFVNADPITVARTLVNDVQARPGRNIGVIVGTQTTGGAVVVTQDYPAGQQQYVDAAVQTLSAMGPDVGFDFAIDVAYNAGIPTKTLNWGYPRRGRVAGSTGLVIDFTNAIDYDWPEDSSTQAITVVELGSGSGPDQLQTTAENANLITGGYPNLTSFMSRTNVTNKALLNKLAVGDLALLANPIVVPAITIPVNGDPPLGAFIVGDDARLVTSPDSRFASGLDTYRRIVSCRVAPVSEGISTMTLTFNDPFVF